MQSQGKRPTLGEMMLQHVIVFLICVVFPGGVTLMAPVTWLTFHRSGDSVQCSTRTCVYFVVPFKMQHVKHVIAISDRERKGGKRRQREYGRETNHYVHVDGEGFLQVQGVGEEFLEVGVSPASLDNVVGKSNDFLKSTQDSMTIFAVANWKFGALMGGVLTSFTLMYVVGYTLALLKFILTLVKNAVFGADSYRDLQS